MLIKPDPIEMRRNIIPYFLASKVVHFSLKFSKQKQKLSNPHHHPSIERKKEAKETKINLVFVLYESELLFIRLWFFFIYSDLNCFFQKLELLIKVGIVFLII